MKKILFCLLSLSFSVFASAPFQGEWSGFIQDSDYSGPFSMSVLENGGLMGSLITSSFDNIAVLGALYTDGRFLFLYGARCSVSGRWSIGESNSLRLEANRLCVRPAIHTGRFTVVLKRKQ